MKINKILIAGEGGQGVQVIAKIITKAAYNSGYDVTYLPNFGVEQRGGVSLAYVQMSKEKISFPKFQKASLLLITAPRAIKRIERYLAPETVIMFDNTLIFEEDLKDFKNIKIAIPATYLSKEKLIPKAFNIILLGALVEELKISKEKEIKKILKEVFAEKYTKEPQLKHFNEKAFEIGADIIKSLRKEEKWRKKVLKS